MGRFTLEDIAAEEDSAAFAKVMGLDAENGVNVIYAAREALAAMRAAQSAFEAPVDEDLVEEDLVEEELIDEEIVDEERAED